jgi:hypothetical protein
MMRRRVLALGISGRWARIVLAGALFAALAASAQSPPGCPPTARDAGITDRESAQVGGEVGATRPLMRNVQRTSFPELAKVDLRVRAFHSQSDYLRTRFSISRFLLLRRMRYFIDVNPALFRQQAPTDGVCSILAHELVHVVSISHGNRIRQFGLVRLLSKRHTAKFERGTDLEAIHRGYGEGLKSFRSWLYTHIPPSKLADKQRNYFSPEEITAIQQKLREQPDLFVYWSRHVPLSRQEIQSSPK